MSYTNNLIGILFNDYYQLTMSYSYWKNNFHNNQAVFEAYFRKNPFGKEFTIFAGIGRFISNLKNYRVTDSDIAIVKSILGDNVDPAYIEYLRNIDLNEVEVYGFEEGSVVFPNEPLIQVCGPIAITQLFETVLLNLTNYASLVATNAAHFRIAADKSVTLCEFGCRRAQGPDGALSGSLYSYIGGFDQTSNVEAYALYSIPLSGTMSHGYVSSHSHSFDAARYLNNDTFKEKLWYLSQKKLKEFQEHGIDTNNAIKSEMDAFVTYASSYPSSFVALIDTYNVLGSGLLNFCAVALGLHELGYRPRGIRLDSGDLAYLSKECRTVFKTIADLYNVPWFIDLKIVASNEITLETLYSMYSEINVFGVGTNLITCSSQPSLGMIYKLVEIESRPCLKLTEDAQKANIPYKKRCYRLFNKQGKAIFDYLTLWDEEAPKAHEKITCYHPFHAAVHANVVASYIQPMVKTLFSKKEICEPDPSILDIKKNVQKNIESIRPDHLRYYKPTPYKVSLSEKLYNAFYRAKHEIPVQEIS